MVFIHETRVSIDYYRRRFLGEPGVSRVILFGSGMDPKRIQELTDALDLPVEVGDPFRQISMGKEVPPALAVATGLALRGLEKKQGEINLLPSERREEMEGIARPISVRVLVALILLGLLKGFSVADLNSREKQIEALRMQQARPADVAPGTPLAQLRLIHGKKQKETHFLRELAKVQGENTSLLTELARLLPGEAWLRNALLEDTVEGKRVLRLSGSAYALDRDKELERINDFLAALRGSGPFSSAYNAFNLDNVQRNKFRGEEITEFQLTCESKPGAQP